MKEFKTYPKIFRVGHKENESIFHDDEDIIIIEEKIDGANFRFILNDGKIIFGSHRQQIVSDIGAKTNVHKNFIKVIKYIEDTYNINKTFWDTHLNNKYIFYGEATFKHTLEYNWKTIPLFLGFDIYDIINEKFLKNDEKRITFCKMGIVNVPLIIECCAKELTLDEDIIPISYYAPITNINQLAEGVVCKNYNKQIFCKYVQEKFKEKNQEVFGLTKKQAKQLNDEELLVATYCTNARIDKIIFKMIIDKNVILNMSLLGELIKKTYEDIIEENWHEILVSNWTINFKSVRKLVAKRCLEVLKICIINNERK
jgi:hypothetical protein